MNASISKQTNHVQSCTKKKQHQQKHLGRNFDIDPLYCNLCDKSNHSESECAETEVFGLFKKYSICNQQDHVEIECNETAKDVKKQKNNKKKLTQKENCKAAKYVAENNDGNVKGLSTVDPAKCQNCVDDDHLKKDCPEALKARKEKNYKRKLKKKEKRKAAQLEEKNARKEQAKQKYPSRDFEIDPLYCFLCDESDHSDTECCYKEAYAFFFTKCSICDETGHTDMECPLFLKAVKEQKNYNKNVRRREKRKAAKNQHKNKQKCSDK